MRQGRPRDYIRNCILHSSVPATLRRDAPAEKRHQRPAQRVRPLGGEDHFGPALVAFPAWRSQQVQQASTTVSVRSSPFPTKQGASSAAISSSRTSLPLRADSASEASSADPTSVTSQPCAKSSIRRLVYSRLTVPLVPSTDTRLDERGSGVAGNRHQSGGVARDQLADQRHHASDDLFLAVTAIGKERIVGDINVVRVGPGADDLAQNRKAAKAGVEDEDRGRG
jgi:hypothetical protein